MVNSGVCENVSLGEFLSFCRLSCRHKGDHVCSLMSLFDDEWHTGAVISGPQKVGYGKSVRDRAAVLRIGRTTGQREKQIERWRKGGNLTPRFDSFP